MYNCTERRLFKLSWIKVQLRAKLCGITIPMMAHMMSWALNGFNWIILFDYLSHRKWFGTGSVNCTISKRIVKNSLFGPPPSIAGSTLKVIFRGFVKLNFCLKIEMLSVRMDDWFTVNLVGVPG